LQTPFSPIILKAIVDVMSGGSVSNSAPPIGLYRSGPEIERLMLDCNLDFRIGSASRVPSLLSFIRTVAAGPEGPQHIMRVIERVCDARDYLTQPEKHSAVIGHLNKMLGPDGYEVAERGGRWVLQQKSGGGPVISQIAAKIAVFDFDTVDRDMTRALASAEVDPEDAVTAACSMVEGVCRSILVELSLSLPACRDIDGLLKAVQEPLSLKPGQADLPPEIAADVRQVLSGLSTATQGIGALRTHAGDDHGRERNFTRIDARIARLAIHASSTVALFLIETWERAALAKARRQRVHPQTFTTSRAE
jgi:hypothetical protein